MPVEKKWEYKYLHDLMDMEEEDGIESVLNELGEKGWELVEASGSELKLSWFILKRSREVKICSDCGAENDLEAEFCTVCGARFVEGAGAKAEERKLAKESEEFERKESGAKEPEKEEMVIEEPSEGELKEVYEEEGVEKITGEDLEESSEEGGDDGAKFPFGDEIEEETEGRVGETEPRTPEEEPERESEEEEETEEERAGDGLRKY